MSVLQRIHLPTRASTAALSFSHDSTASLDLCSAPPRYRFSPGQRLNSNSYFNSIYEFVQRRHGADMVQELQLHLEGDFEVAVYASAFNAAPAQRWRGVFRDCNRQVPVTVPLPHPTADEPNQRFFFELIAQRAGSFYGGQVVTALPPRPVRLAVVLCTFRREQYLRATVAALVGDPSLLERLSAVVVVDNAQTLCAEEFTDERVILLPNRNCGGAGGFSRGMAEVLDKDLGTHILLMDDDIACETEAVLRAIAFYEHSKKQVALAGAMLDMHKPHLHFEAGALYGRAADVPGENPLKIFGLGRGLCLEQSEALDFLLLDERPDYGAFWFFAFPAQMARQAGLALPFFVIGDDIEFGLRLTRRMGSTILALPGVGVWHQPFYSKISSVKRYFFVRNLLVVDALYNKSSYFRVVKALLADLLSDLCKFNYGMVFMLVRAFEDFLRGPQLFTDVDPEELMAGLAAQARKLDDNLEAFTPTQTWGFEQPARESLFWSLVRGLSLGGHLLPVSLLRGQPMQVLLGGTGQWRKNRLCSRALFLHREAGFANARTIDPARGWALAFRLAKDILTGRKRWERARRLWQETASQLSSPKFWKSYCAADGLSREKPAQ